MIQEILPPRVIAVEARRDLPSVLLHPVEWAVAEKMSAYRRQEFATGRACARAALTRLGFPPLPVGRGPMGAPDWPPGVAGSITHCLGYRACAVSREAAAVGIDAEPHAEFPRVALDFITTQAERIMLEQLELHAPGVHLGRVLFSAKEAVCKAWWPLTRHRLGFTDLEVELGEGTFAARPLMPGTPSELTGRWKVVDDLILTAVVVGTE
ncbi:4'-phosphopantetheinyl transferase family protein [Nonomuraea jabiensis]|uniref:4'-phosphopantetheinyl transferase EntD n=1 Tax=Nonomuraea jabiensis TaxID=882448 RepID=A0A7W9GDE8_9ACTN|nr:4'-phosphopantetheinyl transferase superfamily protein [Nonomuraea jabiensis]MBB5781666.1 4'-phosphopantetheinyl transferase EntD [Nonomuraea jabiensis]